MKIICNINDNTNLDNFLLADSIVIPTEYSIFYTKCFDEFEIDDIIKWCVLHAKEAIIKIDQIILENRINNLIRFLDKYYLYDVKFMFSDLSVLDYFKEKNMLNKLIYNAPTYICNSCDISYYNKLGIRVMMSNELSLDDVIKNAEYENVIVQAYGYFPIYYSYRDVINLYKNHCVIDKIDEDINNKINYNNINFYELKEETRSERYNIIEYKNSHSVITSCNKILLYKELALIKANYVYLDFFKTEEDNIKLLLELFKDNSFSDEVLNKIKNIDERVDSSMVYLKPAILGK